MTDYPIFMAIASAVRGTREENDEPKRIEIGRKFNIKLRKELEEMFEGSPNNKIFSDDPDDIEEIQGTELEIRDDVEGFKVIAERPGENVVRTVHGEEYL